MILLALNIIIPGHWANVNPFSAPWGVYSPELLYHFRHFYEHNINLYPHMYPFILLGKKKLCSARIRTQIKSKPLYHSTSIYDTLTVLDYIEKIVRLKISETIQNFDLEWLSLTGVWLGPQACRKTLCTHIPHHHLSVAPLSPTWAPRRPLSA